MSPSHVTHTHTLARIFRVTHAHALICDCTEHAVRYNVARRAPHISYMLKPEKLENEIRNRIGSIEQYYYYYNVSACVRALFTYFIRIITPNDNDDDDDDAPTMMLSIFYAAPYTLHVNISPIHC